MRGWVLVVPVLLAACVGEVATHEDTGAGADAAPGFALTILEPGAGAEIARDQLLGDGVWGARVRLAASPSAPVASVEWVSDGTVLATGSAPDYAATAVLREEGERDIVAIARDDGGRELGRARVTVRVMPSTAGAGCLEQLDALGVDYVEGPARQGVARPVTVTLPLNGLGFRNSSGTARQTLFLDCELALALWRTADLWKARGVVAVVDYGIYNYRCIDQSIAPPCTGTKFSQHAFAMAIDIAVLLGADGTRYSVNDDWIIEDPPSGRNTCTVEPAAGAKNVLLHQALCELYDLEVFKILLTPNYNAAHRNHFHVDLTRQSGVFVGKRDPAILDDGPVDE
jgi:hypothetical protein